MLKPFTLDLPTNTQINNLKFYFRAFSRPNGLNNATSKTSMESFQSSKSTPCHLGRPLSTSVSFNTAKKESFWLSPMSPAVKPGAFDVFQFPSNNTLNKTNTM